MNKKRKSSENTDPVADFESWCFRICGVFRLTDELQRSVRNGTCRSRCFSSERLCCCIVLGPFSNQRHWHRSIHNFHDFSRRKQSSRVEGAHWRRAWLPTVQTAQPTSHRLCPYFGAAWQFLHFLLLGRPIGLCLLTSPNVCVAWFK